MICYEHLGQVIDGYRIPLAGVEDFYVYFGIELPNTRLTALPEKGWRRERVRRFLLRVVSGRE